jgi:hypothetical protein
LHQIPLHKKGNQKYLSAFTKSIQSKVQISSLLLIEVKNFMGGQRPKKNTVCNLDIKPPMPKGPPAVLK